MHGTTTAPAAAMSVERTLDRVWHDTFLPDDVARRYISVETRRDRTDELAWRQCRCIAVLLERITQGQEKVGQRAVNRMARTDDGHHF